MNEAVLDHVKGRAEALCFKSYDIRGVVPQELSYQLARRIGQAIVEVLGAKALVVGRDCRLTSPAISAALVDGVTSRGCDVIDIGVAGTEEVYFATDHFDADAGVAVTASHNPASHNGMKIVGRGSQPLSGDDFQRIQNVSLAAEARAEVSTGLVFKESPRRIYAEFIADCVGDLASQKLVVDAGSGVAGPAFDAVLDVLSRRGSPLRVLRRHHKPDGRFPNGVPNPLLLSRRAETAWSVKEAGADMGVAWDGDFDRCFLFDRHGAFVDGAYLAALLAADALEVEDGGVVLHDGRVTGPMQHAARISGGVARVVRTGHVHMKRAMGETDAVFGGEMSGHNYFRAFMRCDSGMLPWLKVLSIMKRRGASLDELVSDYRRAFPLSGEMNYRVADPEKALSLVEEEFSLDATSIDRFDGLSMVFDGWRLNLRSSSTEPLLRLNIEARGHCDLLSEQVARVDRLLCNGGGSIRVE